MNIAITAVGSRGGLQPYVAFGIGLRDAFHEVPFASSRNDEEFVRDRGLGISEI
jgi:sterol 3beta-glucosyltransferase